MAETHDERWRSCRDLGEVGPIVKTHPTELNQVFQLLRDCAKGDDNGMVRYHAVISLGKLSRHVFSKRPDIVFDICNLCTGEGAKEIGTGEACGLKDPFDRVRRGTMKALTMLVDLPTKRSELPAKIREALSKHLPFENYDIVRWDCYTLMGKIGPPVDKLGERMLIPLDEAVAKFTSITVCKASITEQLEHFIAKLAYYKLDRVHEWKIQLPKDINIFVDRLFPQFDHWSYWPQRECLVRALVEIGHLLPYLTKTLNQVLTMFEQLADDHVFDVRVAVCKGLGEFCPPIKPTSPQSLQRLGPAVWERARPILQRSLNDDNAEVQQAAKTALLNKPANCK